eukprot:scaffold55253_cov61-Phaeocystis_antarctica.AAC.20
MATTMARKDMPTTKRLWSPRSIAPVACREQTRFWTIDLATNHGREFISTPQLNTRQANRCYAANEREKRCGDKRWNHLPSFLRVLPPVSLSAASRVLALTVLRAPQVVVVVLAELARHDPPKRGFSRGGFKPWFRSFSNSLFNPWLRFSRPRVSATIRCCSAYLVGARIRVRVRVSRSVAAQHTSPRCPAAAQGARGTRGPQWALTCREGCHKRCPPRDLTRIWSAEDARQRAWWCAGRSPGPHAGPWAAASRRVRCDPCCRRLRTRGPSSREGRWPPPSE